MSLSPREGRDLSRLASRVEGWVLSGKILRKMSERDKSGGTETFLVPPRRIRGRAETDKCCDESSNLGVLKQTETCQIEMS